MARIRYVLPQVTAMRKRTRLTQEALASAAGVSISTVRAAERGDSVSLRTLEALAKGFGVTPQELQTPKRKKRARGATSDA